MVGADERAYLDRLRRLVSPRADGSAPSSAPPTVLPPTEARYAVPPHFHKTVPADELVELHRLLAELRGLREQVVGLTSLEVLWLYGGHPAAIELANGFDRWTTAHLERRLRRRAHRNAGPGGIDMFHEMASDFIAWLERLSRAPRSGHLAFLEWSVRRAYWEAFERTMGAELTWDTYGLPLTMPSDTKDLLESLRFRHFRVTADVIRDSAWVGADVRGTGIEHRAELRGIAADLLEIRSLLIRYEGPAMRTVRLGPDHYAEWFWVPGRRSGMVAIKLVPTGMFESEPGTVPAVASIGLEGAPYPYSLPWLDLGDDAARWAVGALRPLRHALVDVWMSVQRPARNAVAVDELTEGEIVASACADLGAAETPEPGAATRVPAVRTITLLALLERKFGCEIKQGKGSEITVYRPGGRKFTLPHHRRNAHFPSRFVRALLKAVGIRAEDFARAAG
jgi:hypothetical protein